MVNIPLGPWTSVEEVGESSQSTRSSHIEEKTIITWASVSLKDLVNNLSTLSINFVNKLSYVEVLIQERNMPITAGISTTEVVVLSILIINAQQKFIK